MLRKFFSTLLFVVATSTTQAGIITNNDISSITLSGAEHWEGINGIQLFDGIDYRYTPTRFAVYQNDGDDLSDVNVFNISVALITGYNVSSISFYNDWRYFLGQQVSAMKVQLFGDNNRLLWSDSFSGLQQDTWDQIDLVDFINPVQNVNRIDFTVTGEQGNHFEIRELLVTTSGNTLTASFVSSPNVIGVLFILFTGLLWRYRYAKNKIHTPQ